MLHNTRQFMVRMVFPDVRQETSGSNKCENLGVCCVAGEVLLGRALVCALGVARMSSSP